MRRIVLGLALAGMTFAVAMPAAAQRGRDRGLVELAPEGVRGGFYIGGGFGAGGERYKYVDEPAWSETLTKPTFSLHLGGTVNTNLRLGAELIGWAADEGHYTDTFGAILGTAQFYPAANAGFFVKGGLGFANSGRDYVNPLPDEADGSDSGFAWMVGAGYDAQVSRSIGVGPMIALYEGRYTRRDEVTLVDRVLNIGVQVTFQTGGRRR